MIRRDKTVSYILPLYSLYVKSGDKTLYFTDTIS